MKNFTFSIVNSFELCNTAVSINYLNTISNAHDYLISLHVTKMNLFVEDTHVNLITYPVRQPFGNWPNPTCQAHTASDEKTWSWPSNIKSLTVVHSCTTIKHEWNPLLLTNITFNNIAQVIWLTIELQYPDNALKRTNLPLQLIWCQLNSLQHTESTDDSYQVQSCDWLE